MSLVEHRVLLMGVGITNAAAARALVAHGHEVVLCDDGSADLPRDLASELDVTLHHRPTEDELDALVRDVDAVIPAPGLPEHHGVFSSATAHSRPILSEFDLAAAWDERPVVAVTGTNGKTTVTLLVESMLNASGITARAVGNLETPLVEAISDDRVQCFVVEASSFRLAQSRHFAPAVSTWLNFAEDHLDVHRSLAHYRAAKARVWAEQGPGDVAVVNLDDETVSSDRPVGGPAVVTYALGAEVSGEHADYHCANGRLVGPGGVDLGETASMHRALPHDISNALAASACTMAAGGTADGVRAALASFGGLAHRVEFVQRLDGVDYYDDSKATAPHATLAAASGFDSVVLIAGGRNKGLDLSTLSRAGSVRAVVGIGDAGPEVVDAFGSVPSRLAASMADAVRHARALAAAGDVVLLSPGCASFDWYASYAERGEDFAKEVRALGAAIGDTSKR